MPPMSGPTSGRRPGKRQLKPCEVDLPSGHTQGAPRGLRGVRACLGAKIPEDRGRMDEEELCPVGVPQPSQDRPPLPSYHEPAGASHQGSGRGWWRSSAGPKPWKSFLIPEVWGKEPLRVSKTAHRIRGNTVVKAPRRRTLNETLPSFPNEVRCFPNEVRSTNYSGTDAFPEGTHLTAAIHI